MILDEFIFKKDINHQEIIKKDLENIKNFEIILSNSDKHFVVCYTIEGLTIYPEKEEIWTEEIDLPDEAMNTEYYPNEKAIKFQYNEEKYCIYRNKSGFDLANQKLNN